MNHTVRRLPGPVSKAIYLEGSAADLRLHTRLRNALGTIRAQFLLIVVVPTLIAGAYFGFFAARRYVSETEYIVRGVTSSRSTGLSALLTSFGISRAADDTSAIQAFLESRDAIALLNKDIDLRSVFGASEADIFSRFPRPWQHDSFEALYQTSQNYITVVQDPTKGITTLRVQTFRPADSQRIAKALLQIAEAMVNKMNARAEADAVRNAAEEVGRAEADVQSAQAELTSFRNQELLVDPNAFSTILLQAISKLSIDLVQTNASLTETLKNSASSPVVSTLQAEAETLDERIRDEREKLAGNKAALASKITGYEHMTLMRDMATKRYAAALTTLDSARQEARRQQIYIEEMVAPNLPDEATEPERLRLVLTVFVLCFAAFAMIWILTVGAKDHAQ